MRGWAWFCGFASSLALAWGAETAQDLSLLEKKLKDRQMLVRHSAADQLSQIGGEKVRLIFERLVRQESVEAKQLGLVGLSKVAPEKSALLFAEALDHPHPDVSIVHLLHEPEVL